MIRRRPYNIECKSGKIQPAIYPYLHSEIKTLSIPSGQYSFSTDDIFQGLVPCQLIVGLVASATYMGD